MISLILLLIFTLICSAFFSGMEIAFVSSNKLEAKLKTEQENKRSKMLSHFYKNPSHFIAATLLGNNIALVFFGILFAKLFDPIWVKFLPEEGQEIYLLLIDTLVSTLLVLVIGEYLPKTLFRIDPLRILKALIYPFQFIYWILLIPVHIVIGLTKFFIKLIAGNHVENRQAVFTRFDLKEYINEKLVESLSEDTEDAHDIDTDMLEKVLDLKEVKARECMIPRNEIVGVEQNTNLDEIRQVFIDSKFSKLIIYNESIDNPIGYLHHQDVLKNHVQEHEPLYFPESTPATVMMNTFIKKRKSIAIIVDEYGGTAGLCTLEDVMEEIFGEIKDEYDHKEEDELEEKINDTTYRFSARAEIDYINEKYSLGLPEDNVFETLAGLLLSIKEEIPQKGEVIEFEQFKFTIEQCSPTRIEQVKIEVVNAFEG